MIVFVFLGGVAVATQAGINGTLGRRIGVLESSFVSFFIGTVALFLLMLFFGRGNILATFSVPRWQLTGGLLGAFYVWSIIYAAPKIGVATSLMAVIIGQLFMSTLLDHYGFVGKTIPIDMQRTFALLLMIVALFLFYRK
ncbi:DMT family transporter [Salirhabdus salicampi]|uniref:DMT family transporter n=1 Tax=Salirhabdus salicampi TaxID=476102 RepID=UPI0020C3CA8E|nr:DMT family transporter [Salirhabdus salicampi]MCP8615846.1 DMT family transporter [Salirhabdus salicampi]